MAEPVYGTTVSVLRGDAFHIVESGDDIASALNQLQSQGADFVKTYLVFSEDYARRAAMTTFIQRA
jgi:hypothetical protein